MKANKIVSFLDELIEDPKCELLYDKDYELLLAVMLSAQTTDKRVNEVTRILFSKYPTLKSLKDADIEDIKNIIRPIGTFNKKAENIIKIAQALLADCGGKVPNDRYTIETKLMKVFKKYSLSRLHHQLVLFGRYYCKAQNPFCEKCGIRDICKYK